MQAMLLSHKALQEGYWCWAGAFSTAVMLSTLPGGVLCPPSSLCKNIPPPKVHRLQDMAEFGALFFCFFVQIVPQKHQN